MKATDLGVADTKALADLTAAVWDHLDTLDSIEKVGGHVSPWPTALEALTAWRPKGER